MDGLDTTSPFLPLPEGLVIASLSETESQLRLSINFGELMRLYNMV